MNRLVLDQILGEHERLPPSANEIAWEKKLSELPKPEPFVLWPELNHGQDDLDCFLCLQRRPTVEWVVTLQSPGKRFLVGVHERCRQGHVRYQERHLVRRQQAPSEDEG